MISNEQGQLLLLRSYQFSDNHPTRDMQTALQEILVEDVLLNLAYKQISVAVATPIAATLVPNALFQEQNASLYLDNSTDISRHSSVVVDTLPTLEAQNIYALDTDVLHLLTNYFPKGEFYHISTPLLLAWRNMVQHRNGHNIFVHVLSRQLHIAVFNKQKLEFYNTFQYQTAQDFIYFVLLVHEQLNLKVEQTPMTISGELMKDSKVYELVHRYVRHVHFMSRPPYYHFGEQFKTVAEHFFFDLYSLKLCG